MLAALAAGALWLRERENASSVAAEPVAPQAWPEEQVAAHPGRSVAQRGPALPIGWPLHEGPLSDPRHRARAVAQARAYFQQQRQVAAAWAQAQGVAWRTAQQGQIRQLGLLRQGRPLFRITRNVNAALSAGVWPLWQAPWELSGAGQTVGIWDGGVARVTHVELIGRTVNEDEAEIDWHTTHVTGTIAATGLVAAAQGMAPQIHVEVRDWDDDYAEMLARGCAYPGEDDKLLLSNHSYGFSAGWQREPGRNLWVWDGGSAKVSHDAAFGRYSEESRFNDAVAYALPYYLIVRAAGNDRADNPKSGDRVRLSPASWQVVTYNPQQHPPGDGVYREGYDSLSYDELAKNVITVGSVSDAIQGMRREVKQARVSSFSSWGPVDDGRIKPDLVANGEEVYSTTSEGDTRYGEESGTSMATASVSGAVALLNELYEWARPGQALRASTLKALLLHTADDLGPPGPDYQTGWGLLNAEAAAKLLQHHLSFPTTPVIVEDEVTEEVTERSYILSWNGNAPLRLTLVWMDLPGEVVESDDNRVPHLVHDLDLVVVGPEGEEHLPFVMPFVGDWSAQTFSAPAVRGKNHTDNVEQIVITPPAAAGVYTARVRVEGGLTEDRQVFSLVISGATAAEEPEPVSLLAVSPTEGAYGVVPLTLTGHGFQLGATVMLSREGEADVPTFGCEVVRERLVCRVPLDGVAPGRWDVVVTNPDGRRAVLPQAFQVRGAVWGDSLEREGAGWTTRTVQGAAPAWALSSIRHHSGRQAFTVQEPGEAALLELETPAIAVPETTTLTELRFWQAYRLPAACGGVLEVSVDDGETWVDAAAPESGFEFAENGYTGTMEIKAHPLAGRECWTGEAQEFQEVVMPVVDPGRFRGRVMRLRWRLGRGEASAAARPGYWVVDDVALIGQEPDVPPPVITAEATVEPFPVTGIQAILRVSAEGLGEGSPLVYTWECEDESRPPVTFEPNGTPEANVSQATFRGPGVYPLRVTVANEAGQTATSRVDVLVISTGVALQIRPRPTQLLAGMVHPFMAVVLDQFGDVYGLQPPPEAVAWTIQGGEWVGPWRFLSGEVGEDFSLTASYGGWSDTYEGMIVGRTWADWQTAWFGSPDAEGAGELEDTDGDTMPNLMEFALGGNPLTFTPLPEVAVEEGVLVLSFARPLDLPGVIYMVEASADLETWEEVPVETISQTTGEELVRARVPLAGEETESRMRFLRLRVERVAE